MGSKISPSAALAWSTEKRKVSALVPYPKNPRSMSDKQRKDLEASILKFNLVELPVVDTDNTLVAGHQRLALLMMLGRGNETIDVRVPNRKLTPEEFKEYNIRSNRQAGAFDTRILESMFDFSELIDWGFSATELPKNMAYDNDALNEGKTVNKNHKIGFSYKLQFKNQDQLDTFTRFLNAMKLQYPDQKFISHRILKFFNDKGV